MGRGVFGIRRLSYLNRFISLASVSAYTFSILPVYVFSKSHHYQENVFQQVHLDPLDILPMKINELKETLRLAENRNLEAVKAIQSLLDEVNFRYDTSFSLSELCKHAKENLNLTIFDEDLRCVLMNVVKDIELTNTILDCNASSREPESFNPYHLISLKFDVFVYHIYAPWDWNWFGLNKEKHRKVDGHATTPINRLMIPSLPNDIDIPDDLILAGIEIFAAVLLFLIPSGYTQAASGLLVADALTRGVGGLKEISDFNKLQQFRRGER